MSKGKPITPAEAREHASPIPGAVFDVFNSFLALGAGIRSVTFKEKDVVAEMKQRGIDINEAYEKHWLDVEAAYEVAGWKVTYDKPGYNETYDATFTFAPKTPGKDGTT